MFDNKKFLLFLATAALVAACGGGGDTTSNNLPGSDTGGDTGGNGGDDGNDGGGDGEEQVNDQTLNGRLVMVGNSVVYVRRDRTMYLPVPLERFEDAHGMNDVAPGFTGDEEIGEPYRPWDGVQYEPPQTYAPAAPIAAFGIRVDKRVQRIAPTDVIANQRAVGRVAVELAERSDGPAWLQSGQREIIRYVIDNVELSTNAAGELSARVLPNSNMHVYGRNAGGVVVNETIPLPEAGTEAADVVSMLTMERIPDNFGDRTSEILLFDFEKAFSRAGSRLDALTQVRGYFDIRVTLSSVREIVRPASCSNGYALPRKELRGEDITVEGQPVVKGAGLSGYAWIRTYDPAPPPDRGYDEPPGPDTCPPSAEETPAP